MAASRPTQPYNQFRGVYNPPFEQQNAAFAEALKQQQLQEQMQMQILQALGFTKNWNQSAGMSSLPYNAGLLIRDGQAYVRPGGIDQHTQQLLQALLGVKRSPEVAGLQDPRALTMPGGGVPGQGSRGVAPYEADVTTRAASQAVQNPNMLEFFLRLYPELYGLRSSGGENK